MKTHKNCPICGNNKLEPSLEVADFFLTQEQFHIMKCPNCGFEMTQPFPDKNEIERYYQSDEYYSHPHKKKSLVSLLYEKVKQRNLKYKFRIATSGLNRGVVLDIGCGSGDFMEFAKNKNWNVCGIEPNALARNYAEQKLKIQIFNSLESATPHKTSFDVITLWHVLEHIENLNEQVEAIKKLLKPGGRVVIALPNPDSYDAKYYGKFWAAYDVPRHLYHFRFKNIREFMSKHQFRFLKREPMKWDAFYIALLSEKYKYGRQRLLSALIHGIISNLHAKKNREFSSNIYIFYADL